MRSEILISFLGCSSICFNLSIISLNLDKLLCPSAFCFFLSFVCHVQTSEFFEAETGSAAGLGFLGQEGDPAETAESRLGDRSVFHKIIGRTDQI